ncbi:sulfatase-like hydrolase/transferase [Thermococcus piezophilus]|uniref:Sulfatase N-terminal domain-containing protein n=1 Tax=Thermococcus piezophilus TaxID=1712654 RepID=A0A172WGQ3_9EURY|nr:sulfatase-like hydrolase/transferase [Thermococcus piezophilus]ANF22624.1 hypothetical protein A7C91_05155 [Thermococcus piezophilus]
MDYVNVIFILIDTLRKDYAKPLETELKRLDFISYENAIAPAPWTIPSHASLFTGFYPALHGAHETKSKKGADVKLNDSYTMTIRLKELGYESWLLTSNPYIHPRFGFSGFDYIYEPPLLSKMWDGMLSLSEREKLKRLKQIHNWKTKSEIIRILLLEKHFKLLVKISLEHVIRRLYINQALSMFKGWPKEKGSRDIIEELKKSDTLTNEPKFIFINLMEVHEPYSLFEKPIQETLENLKRNKPVDPNLVKNWRKKYPEEVEYVTKKILEMMRIFKETEIFDDSLIIVTSDHGQLLGEHGRINHGTFLYDELLRVPLLIKYPTDYEIEHVTEDSKYISLTKLKPFIFGIIGNDLDDDSILYEETVFAESYGTHLNVGEPSNEEEKRNIEQLEKYRIAIYYKNFKGIFNVTDWKFEKIKSYDPNIEVTDDIVKHMKKEVIKFLKTATIAKVPKIKL